jgi:hypothetical protein
MSVSVYIFGYLITRNSETRFLKKKMFTVLTRSIIFRVVSVIKRVMEKLYKFTVSEDLSIENGICCSLSVEGPNNTFLTVGIPCPFVCLSVCVPSQRSQIYSLYYLPILCVHNRLGFEMHSDTPCLKKRRRLLTP